MRVRTSDGVGLEAVVEGIGPGLLLVHGFGGAKEDFADHVAALAQRHRVVAFDHRGHGESDHPADPSAYSLDRMASDVLEVAAAAGLASFRLLGHSMGGMVARRVVLAAAARVDALVLMDTSPGPPPGMSRKMVELGATIAIEQGMAELKRVLDAFGPLETPAYHHLLLERPGYREFSERKFAMLSPVMWATMARELVDQPDQLALLASVRCATLVMVGEQDETFVGPSEAMASMIAHARFALVRNAGHSPQFENPAHWYAALHAFLDGLAVAA